MSAGLKKLGTYLRSFSPRTRSKKLLRARVLYYGYLFFIGLLRKSFELISK
ncbi:unnamed protein product, partial [Nesidiocoris tenuis]